MVGHVTRSDCVAYVFFLKRDGEVPAAQSDTFCNSEINPALHATPAPTKRPISRLRRQTRTIGRIQKQVRSKFKTVQGAEREIKLPDSPRRKGRIVPIG